MCSIKKRITTVGIGSGGRFINISVALNLCEGEAEAGLQLPANLCDQRDQMLSSTTAIKVRERKRRARSDRPILFLNGTMALCSLVGL